MQGSRILLVIGGGIAAYKSLTLIRDLRREGYRVVPVNPLVAREGWQILGETAYASVTEAAAALAAQGVKIDMVDCFRKSEDIPPLAEEAVAVGARCLWLQLGVFNEAAVQQAEAAGLLTVQNR